MRRGILYVVAVALIIAAAGTTALAVDQGIQVSGNLKLVNDHVRIAVGPNGNAVVVWDQNHHKKNDRGRVYGAYLTRNANGTYSAGQPFLVSSNTGTHNRPDVIYVPNSGHFLIVWDTGPNHIHSFDPQSGLQFLGTGPTKIFMRMFDPSEAGAPDSALGDTYTAVDDGENIVGWARLVDFSSQEQAPAATNYSQVAMFYSSMNVSQVGPACDYRGYLVWGMITYYFICQSLYYNDRATLYELNGFAMCVFYFAHRFYAYCCLFVPEGVADYLTTLFVLSAFASLQADEESVNPLAVPSPPTTEVTLGSRRNAYAGSFCAAAPLGTNRLVCINNFNEEGSGTLDSLNSSLGGHKNYGSPTKKKDLTVTHADFVRLNGVDYNGGVSAPAKSDTWAVYRTSDGRIRIRNLKPTGKPSGKEKTAFKPSNNFQGMDAAAYGDELLLAWVEKMSKKKSVVRMRIVTIR